MMLTLAKWLEMLRETPRFKELEMPRQPISSQDLANTSPFMQNLPGMQFAWDSTSLGWFKECPRKYYYSMIEGWRSRGESVHLTFGIHYHKALENYDKARSAGADHNEALHSCVWQVLRDTFDRESGTAWSPDHDKKTRFTLIRSIIWYLEEFRDDVAHTIQLANGAPAVELSFRFEVDNGLFLCGHLDRAVNYLDGAYVMDRKTTTSTPGAYYFDQYSPHNQMSLYSLAGQIILNSPIRGVIIDAAQIAVGFTRFSRGVVSRTPAQLGEWLEDFYSTVNHAHNCASQDHWPMNDTACDKFGGCAFRKVCSRDPSVRQAFLETDFEIRKWNPLEVR